MSPQNLLGRTVFAFVALVFVTESLALSCRVRFQTSEYELNLKYAWAELVAVGTIVPSTEYGAGNFQVEGIWKGPDLKMLDVSFWSGEPPAGTRLAIYGRRSPHNSIAFADSSTTCSWNWGYRNGDRDYEGLIAKTEELFGAPRKPDMFLSNFVLLFALAIAFLTLFGVGQLMSSYISSSNRRAKASVRRLSIGLRTTREMA